VVKAENPSELYSFAIGFLVYILPGKRIQLLLAWPLDRTADFKLHAPYRTTIEGHVEDGKITHLKVDPQERARDVFVDTPGSLTDNGLE